MADRPDSWQDVDIALESRRLWLEMLEASGIRYKTTGSLHIACRDDEAEVGREFARLAPAHEAPAFYTVRQMQQ